MSNDAKKRGRPTIGARPMSTADRQRRARSFAMNALCDGNIIEISNSSLVDLLPRLISSRSGRLVETVCKELIRRAATPTPTAKPDHPR